VNFSGFRTPEADPASLIEYAVAGAELVNAIFQGSAGNERNGNMMTKSFSELDGLSQQSAGGTMTEVWIAAAIILAAIVGVVSWRVRARAARRLHAAGAAYAEREIARQRQLSTTGCPA
jgi:hypothetical protein